MNVAECNKQ